MSETVNAQDLADIEQSIEQSKKSIARKDAMVRLEKNADFQLLITEGFLKDHALRQVMLKAHPGFQDEVTQGVCARQIVACGEFKQYLVAVYAEGVAAEQALAADEATQEAILAEGLE